MADFLFATFYFEPLQATVFEKFVINGDNVPKVCKPNQINSNSSDFPDAAGKIFLFTTNMPFDTIHPRPTKSI